MDNGRFEECMHDINHREFYSIGFDDGFERGKQMGKEVATQDIIEAIKQKKSRYQYLELNDYSMGFERAFSLVLEAVKQYKERGYNGDSLHM